MKTREQIDLNIDPIVVFTVSAHELDQIHLSTILKNTDLIDIGDAISQALKFYAQAIDLERSIISQNDHAPSPKEH